MGGPGSGRRHGANITVNGKVVRIERGKIMKTYSRGKKGKQTKVHKEPTEAQMKANPLMYLYYTKK